MPPIDPHDLGMAHHVTPAVSVATQLSNSFFFFSFLSPLLCASGYRTPCSTSRIVTCANMCKHGHEN